MKILKLCLFINFCNDVTRSFQSNTKLVKNIFLSNNINKCLYTGKILTEADFSIEHVLPKCYLPKHLKYDSLNLLPCHSKTNNNRSNYPFYETPFDLIDTVEKNGIYVEKTKQIVYLNSISKGIVARRILYYNNLLKKNFNNVLDIDLAKRWSYENEPKDYEMQTLKLIIRSDNIDDYFIN